MLCSKTYALCNFSCRSSWYCSGLKAGSTASVINELGKLAMHFSPRIDSDLLLALFLGTSNIAQDGYLHTASETYFVPLREGDTESLFGQALLLHVSTCRLVERLHYKHPGDKLFDLRESVYSIKPSLSAIGAYFPIFRPTASTRQS
jgi:hypothetical protein